MKTKTACSFERLLETRQVIMASFEKRPYEEQRMKPCSQMCLEESTGMVQWSKCFTHGRKSPLETARYPLSEEYVPSSIAFFLRRKPGMKTFP
jgi:hypothetical protein